MKTTMKPAILGGPRAITLDDVKANRWPIITREDRAAVMRVLDDGKLNMHPVIKEFEENCKRYFGVKHVLSHCNGTAALLACFFSLNPEPGDEIIVPTATFWASALPMMWAGLVPVFCDSEAATLGPDPEDIEKKITPRTRAIVVVHLWGLPCKMDQIYAVAEKHGLKIIEDASHAQGAQWHGKMCGALGDVSAVSVVGNKLLPAGEGGLFLTNDSDLYEKAVCLGDIARIAELTTPAKRFAATGFGLKTRIASVSAALGNSQLRFLDTRNMKRNKNIEYLSRRLETMGFETFLNKEKDVKRVYFEFIIRKKESLRIQTEVLVASLRAEGCRIGIPRYPLLHRQPVFTEGHYRRIIRTDREFPDYASCAFPSIESILPSVLRLPTFPGASRKLLNQYAEAFDKVISNAEVIMQNLKNGNIKIDAAGSFVHQENVLVL